MRREALRDKTIYGAKLVLLETGQKMRPKNVTKNHLLVIFLMKNKRCNIGKIQIFCR
jgi:hypothetical protein